MKYAQKMYITSLDDTQDFPEWEMQPGMKVVYSNVDSGKVTDFREGLVPGDVYTLKEVRVSRFHTEVELEEIPGHFNSVFFSLKD